MKKNAGFAVLFAGLAGLAAVLGAACQKEDAETKERLRKINEQLTVLEQKVDGLGPRGAAAAPQAPQAPPPGRPDPGAVYSVPVDGNPALGPATAKVTIVEGAEFACPFCQRVAGTMDELRKQYGDDVRIVWKHYVVHPQVATTPALATCAAQGQGKFFELEHLIWEKSWQDGSMKDLSEAAMIEHARALGLNLDKFKADMNGDACKQLIAKDQAALAAVGQRGTPGFFINGRFLSGAQPIDRFKAVIDEELKKANEAIQGGKKADEYYSSIVAGGKKSL